MAEEQGRRERLYRCMFLRRQSLSGRWLATSGRIVSFSDRNALALWGDSNSDSFKLVTVMSVHISWILSCKAASLLWSMIESHSCRRRRRRRGGEEL
jgi:hypothetical protein